ncbi:MAG: hypothetical protein ACT4OX_13635, partial [Actinomycetota bacterium]
MRVTVAVVLACGALSVVWSTPVHANNPQGSGNLVPEDSGTSISAEISIAEPATGASPPDGTTSGPGSRRLPSPIVYTSYPVLFFGGGLADHLCATDAGELGWRYDVQVIERATAKQVRAYQVCV